MTPEQVRFQLVEVGREQSKAHDAIERLEVEAERAELHAQSVIDKAFLTTEGSIPERQAVARERALPERDAAVIARASYNRARSKSKYLESETMRLMAVLKSIQIEGA